MKESSLFFLAIIIAIFVSGCSDDGDDSEDTEVPQDTATDTGTGPAVVPAVWEFQKVEETSVGLQVKLAVGSDDVPVVAYFANEPVEDGLCDSVPLDPPMRLRQELRFARRASPDSSWVAESVTRPVYPSGPTGLALAVSSAGIPTVAFTGSEPQEGTQYCGSHDAVVGYREGAGWRFEIAGAESGDSVTDNAASNAGFVVGLWPSLAYDLQGNLAVVHKDVHFGALQSDDFRRADAEFAWNSGGWIHEAIDYGEGAGDSSSIAFDTQGRPVVLYAIKAEAQAGNSRHGIWAARRELDGTWNQIRLHVGAAFQETAVAVHPETGDLVTAFYSAKDLAVRVRTLSESERFEEIEAWSDEKVADPLYDEGQYVSLAFTPAGEIALAYHRCKLLTSNQDGCDQNDEAVIFAVEKESGWQKEVVVESTGGSCGEYTSLAFDSKGTAFIAYRCTEKSFENTEQVFVFRLFVASKEFGGGK
jgi:hypothetical protein